MLVVKIGGTNGSGKTTLVREIIRKHQLTATRVPGVNKVECYTGLPPVELRNYFKEMIVLGSYESVCGGMDTLPDKDAVRALVHKYATSRTLLIFEGLITGKTYGYLGELSETEEHFGKWLYVLMDTPYEQCVENIRERRKAKGNEAEFDPDRTVLPTFKACLSTFSRAMLKGHPALALEYLPVEKGVASLFKTIKDMATTPGVKVKGQL